MAKKELYLQGAWLKAVLNGIGDAVITTDADIEPKITFLNPIAEKLTGWTRENAKGRSVREVFKIVNQTTRLK